MSLSTPAERKPRIPFQPNPFGSAATGSPWTNEVADVPAINDRPFRTILSALSQIRMGAKGTSIVLIGEPGSGKTHLLGRLRSRLQEDERQGKGATIYVYVRCNASAGTLWRHLQHALASDLMKQLHDVFRSDPHRLERVDHGGVRRVLECLRDGRHVHAASAWLRGELPGDADLALLGLAVDKEDEEHTRERDARLAVDAILGFLAPTPVVVCFDQVEALETYGGEIAGYHAMGQMISALSDTHDHLLLISCIVSAFEQRFDQLSNGADKDRWLHYKEVLRPINREQAEELVKARLAVAPQLTRTADPLWPLDEAALKPLFGETGLCLPRTLIRECERQFAALMGEAQQLTPPKTREAFLQEEFDRNLVKARKIVEGQGIGKTLSDCLPWLLQRSGLAPLGPSLFANQAWRGQGGDFALAFCDGGGNALTNQLKRIERHWTAKTPKLAILRNVSTRPGEKGAAVLARLKQRGAREVDPLPEALAVLQAIRNLVADARSGELFFGDETVSEQIVSDWAFANLPPQVEALRNALIGSQREPEDPMLPRLSALMAERKIVAAAAAASELDITAEEVRDCAHRHPMRFGILDGPPVVVFEATEGPAR